MTHLEELKAVIVKANPEIIKIENLCDICDGTKCHGLEVKERPIRLADVLLALGADGFVDKEQENNIMNCLVRWEYTDDNLTHQSPETINFLHKILVGEKG